MVKWQQGVRGGAAHHTLLHQCAHPEPEAVEQGEVILHDVRPGVAGMSIVPLIRAEPVVAQGKRELVSQDEASDPKGPGEKLEYIWCCCTGHADPSGVRLVKER